MSNAPTIFFCRKESLIPFRLSVHWLQKPVETVTIAANVLAT
ncbi:hypothetical protein MSKU3_0244 [Komagataeibacter oboediens]|nr:hypothetical protein MSKU3_0244 [Komagataeibacter oboediens]